MGMGQFQVRKTTHVLLFQCLVGACRLVLYKGTYIIGSLRNLPLWGMALGGVGERRECCWDMVASAPKELVEGVWRGEREGGGERLGGRSSSGLVGREEGRVLVAVRKRMTVRK